MIETLSFSKSFGDICDLVCLSDGYDKKFCNQKCLQSLKTFNWYFKEHEMHYNCFINGHEIDDIDTLHASWSKIWYYWFDEYW